MEKMIDKFAGITIIYFNDEKKNHYAKPQPDKEIAKKLAKCIYRNVMENIALNNDKNRDVKIDNMC